MHVLFEARPSLIHRIMFDELTTSNAEAECLAVKISSFGIGHCDTLYQLFQKSNIDAEAKLIQRINCQINYLNIVDTVTLCPLSRYAVNPIFQILKLINLRTKCLSKQFDCDGWVFSYRCCHTIKTHIPDHLLHSIQP